MAYVVKFSYAIYWVGDGVGNSPQPAAQVLKLFGSEPVPGGDSPSSSNLNTVGVTIGVDIGAGLNANITQIQGFSTGGA
jgi:hypothetical protein